MQFLPKSGHGYLLRCSNRTCNINTHKTHSTAHSRDSNYKNLDVHSTHITAMSHMKIQLSYTFDWWLKPEFSGQLSTRQEAGSYPVHLAGRSRAGRHPRQPQIPPPRTPHVFVSVPTGAAGAESENRHEVVTVAVLVPLVVTLVLESLRCDRSGRVVGLLTLAS